MQALLQKIQQRIQTHDHSPQLECWLQDVGLAEDREGQLALICPNVFSKRWLEERYKGPLERVIREETGRQVALSFRVSDPCPGGELRGGLGEANLADPFALGFQPPRTLPQQEEQDGSARDGTSEPSPSPGRNPQFSFSNFVVGPPNRFAWSAAQELCKGAWSHYNPLLVLASTGLGKTHLAGAIAHLLASQDPKLHVVCCTAEGFFNEMILHLKNRSIPVFKDKYRKHCDAFILDGIQFILGKTALQSELCHTLDDLLHHEKRVILAGDLPTRDAKGLSDNLRSRMFSGLVVSIDKPDYEMRLEILTRFTRNAGVAFPEGTLETLARLIRSEVRDLEGAFKRLLAWHSLLPDPVGPETIEAHFMDLARGSPKPLSLDDIRKHVAQYFRLSPEDLSSRTRQNKVLYPRQVCMYLSRKHTHPSLEAIGSLYKRDHSSVLYALRSLERKAARSPRIGRELQFIEDRLLERA